MKPIIIYPPTEPITPDAFFMFWRVAWIFGDSIPRDALEEIYRLYGERIRYYNG